MSDETLQDLWARLLAGELESSGSVSNDTMSIARDLNKECAEEFQTLCSAALCYSDGTPMIVVGCGGPGANSLQPYGLSYDVLMRLAHHRLIVSDMNSYIDLSVGSLMGVSAVMTGGLVQITGLPAPLAVIIALITGMLLGLLNGLLVTWWRIPSFIITLGTLAAFRAMTERLQFDFFGKLQSSPIRSDELKWFASGEVLGRVPVSFYIFVGVALVAYYLLAHSKVGIWFFAVGGNERSAHAAGISSDRVRILAFVISGCTSALAGAISTARFQASLASTGNGFEFEAITAVIIGGASLFGGSGSMLGTMLGVLLLRVLINGLTHLDVVFYDQMLIRAAIFIGVLWVDAAFRQRGRLGSLGA